MSIYPTPWSEILPFTMFWKNLREDKNYIMQENTGVWMYKYRIISRNGRKLVASAKTRKEIETDWDIVHEELRENYWTSD